MEPDWGRVADAITREQARRHWTRAELIRKSGVGGDTIDAWKAGQPVSRKDKERGLCDAFGWPPDMLSRIAMGEEPQAAEPSTDVAVRVAALEAGVAELRAGLAELRAQLPGSQRAAPARRRAGSPST